MCIENNERIIVGKISGNRNAVVRIKEDGTQEVLSVSDSTLAKIIRDIMKNN